MSGTEAIIAARAKAVAARARLDASIETARQRLSPRSLAHGAVDSARDRAVEVAQTGLQTVRDRPGATAAVLGAIGLALAHKPLRSLVSRAFGRGDATPDDTTS